MGDVVCFRSGEIIAKPKKPKARKKTVRLIEALYQRRHQIEDIAIIASNKMDYLPLFMCSASDVDRRILWTHFDDYMRDYSDVGFEDE